MLDKIKIGIKIPFLALFSKNFYLQVLAMRGVGMRYLLLLCLALAVPATYQLNGLVQLFKSYEVSKLVAQIPPSYISADGVLSPKNSADNFAVINNSSDQTVMVYNPGGQALPPELSAVPFELGARNLIVSTQNGRNAIPWSAIFNTNADFEPYQSAMMLDEILKCYKEIIEIENKIEKLVIKMQEDSSEKNAEEYTKLHDKYELLDGYTYKKEYETAINKFGFSKEDKNKKLSEFSGGQRTKIAFIKLLLSKPDILLLDEPTNHLDITTIEWLEEYLKNYPKAIIIVSHDRMFINKIVDKIYEIEYGTITEYSGNYEFFEKQKRINY